MEEHNKKVPLFKKQWFIALGIIIVVGAIASTGGDHSSKNENAQVTPSGNQAIAQASPTVSGTVPSFKASPLISAKISVKLKLTSGNYKAGIDFPAGTYDITAVSGKGNVYSSNMFSGGINAAMGTQDINKKLGSDIYEQEYSNIRLTDGAVLSVSGGVVIQIASNNADGTPLSPRQQTNTETVELDSGNFVAGKDFPAGTYDVIALSGSGNVHSDNMFNGGINAAMGTEEENKKVEIDLYEQRYNHIEFPTGTTLSISGVKIQLVPSE